MFECATHISSNWCSKYFTRVFAIYEDDIIVFLNEFALLKIGWRGFTSQIFSIQAYLWASLFNSIWKQAYWTKSNNLPTLWKVKWRVYESLISIDYLIILAITNSSLLIIRCCSFSGGMGTRKPVISAIEMLSLVEFLLLSIILLIYADFITVSM